MIQKSTIEKISEYYADKKALADSRNQLEVYRRLRSKCMTSKKQTYDKPIKEISSIIEDLQLILNRDIRCLTGLIRTEDDRYYVFYLHEVKKKSLTETAKLTNYSRAGVCKILYTIRQKCILASR